MQRRLVARHEGRQHAALFSRSRERNDSKSSVLDRSGSARPSWSSTERRIPDDPHVYPPVAPDLGRVTIHLDQRSIGREGLGRAIAQAEIQGRAHHQDHVGGGQRLLAGVLEEVGVLGRKRTPRRHR